MGLRTNYRCGLSRFIKPLGEAHDERDALHACGELLSARQIVDRIAPGDKQGAHPSAVYLLDKRLQRCIMFSRLMRWLIDAQDLVVAAEDVVDSVCEKLKLQIIRAAYDKTLA